MSNGGEGGGIGPGGSRGASRSVPRGGSTTVTTRGPEVAGVVVVAGPTREVPLPFVRVALRTGADAGTPVGAAVHADGYGRFRIPLPAGQDASQLFLVVALEDDQGIVRVSYFDGVQPWKIRCPESGSLSGDLARLRVHLPRQRTQVCAQPPATGTLTAQTRDAAWVYLTILYGYSWYDSQRVAYQAALSQHTPRLPRVNFRRLGKVVVVFPANEHDVDYTPEDSLPGIVGLIRLNPPIAASPTIILHEYGHHVVQEAVPNYFAPGGPHARYGPGAYADYLRQHKRELWVQQADGQWWHNAAMPAAAWRFQLGIDLSEGYATFFGQNASGTPHYRDREFRAHDDIEDMRHGNAHAAAARCHGYGDVPTAGWLWDLTDPVRGAVDTIQLPWWEVHARFIHWGTAERTVVGSTGYLTLPSFAGYLRTAYSPVAGFSEGLDSITRINRLTRVFSGEDEARMAAVTDRMLPGPTGTTGGGPGTSPPTGGGPPSPPAG